MRIWIAPSLNKLFLRFQNFRFQHFIQFFETCKFWKDIFQTITLKLLHDATGWAPLQYHLKIAKYFYQTLCLSKKNANYFKNIMLFNRYSIVFFNVKTAFNSKIFVFSVRFPCFLANQISSFAVLSLRPDCSTWPIWVFTPVLLWMENVSS